MTDGERRGAGGDFTAMTQSGSRLRADRLSIGYDDAPIIADLSVDVLDGRVTAIVGPNACGKSTLLRGLARLLKPAAGRVIERIAPVLKVKMTAGPVIDFGPKAGETPAGPSGEER